MVMSPTGSSKVNDLRALYERSGNGPLARGDRVDGVQVIGFGFALEPQPFSRGNDRLLLAGDENCEQAPPRGLPTRSDEENGVRVERSGPHAAQRLSPQSVIPAGEIAPRLAAAVEAVIPPWTEVGDFLRSLIDTSIAREHPIWLVGGAVRDLIADADGAVNDLDFCGSMLLGDLYEVVDELLSLAGLGDHRSSVSVARVFSIAPTVHGERIFEYKSLSQNGFRFPASGGDLLDDARTRDLTVNGIYYDPYHHVVIDPTGHGIDHLRAVPRRIVPLCREGSEAEQAQIILRGLKFKVRWPDADVTELAKWVGSLPGDLVTRIPEDRRAALSRLWQRYVPEARQATATNEAENLGPAASRLLQTLQEGRSHDA
ncbi:hypothetical protein MF672_031930 [Actinomadura sp. ATCC 31491]|uniref:Poly A polymerase head domain-containing protein n=1 Tax=Actinomadura luzonensis TaxID=2805427 RepID=A0ABT0G1G8_9ACTN|nr:hypothetical protein [Actinomadura luzonensis]MCK2218369.1 hypothetical protein [Actinomadura luzonensis]